MEDEAMVGGVPVVTSVPVETVSVPAAVVLPAAVPVEKEYLLTVRVRFMAMDDPAARRDAIHKLDMFRLWSCEKQAVEVVDGTEVKFQEVSKSMPPRKVEL